MDNQPPAKSATTLAYYAKVIKQMREAIAPGTEGLNFLADFPAVKAWIENGRSLNSKKTYYAVVKSALSSETITPEMLKSLTNYNKAFTAVAAEVKKQVETQKATPREESAMLPWLEIVKATDEFVATAIDAYDPQMIQDAALMACYVYQPPRRLDFSPMKVVARQSKTIKENYLSVSPKKMTFVFQDYKTAKTYGIQKQIVPQKLEAVLRQWLDLNSSGWLFTTHEGTPMTEANLSAHLIRLFERQTGKKIGVDILRHSFISHLREGEMPLKQKQALAKKMGHSVATNELYRRI